MITPQDFYKVVSAVVPLYVAMILAYGSVRWWKILTPDQCGGINRFVAIFAVPLLSFQIIAHNDPYKMNVQFIAADALQKVAVIFILGIWAKYSKNGSMEWMITLFMLGTLPNTLVMGIPLLAAMYGTTSGSLVVQAVVLQCIIWYTLLLFLYEYRSAKSLILEQFPKNAAAIVSFKVDSDVMSLDGRDPIQTDAEIGEDGKLHVTVRRSTSSRHSILSPRRSIGLNSMPSSKALTPRPSNLTGAEIYSIHSSRNLTPRESSFNPADFYSMMTSNTAPNPDPRQSNFTASDIYSLHSSRGPTPRTSNFTEENSKDMGKSASPRFATHSFYPSAGFGGRAHGSANLNAAGLKKLGDQKGGAKVDDDTKELHMFVWSSTGSPISDVFGSTEYVAGDASRPEFDKDVRLIVVPQTDEPNPHSGARDNARHNAAYEEDDRDDFSFGNRASSHGDDEKDGPNLTKNGSNSTAELNPKNRGDALHTELPGMRVMTRLILDMVWRKLIRNPNTYSSLIGLTWALISYRWHVKMPAIVENSILILSSAGLGMAMFSLGLFMALQKRILACGTSLAIFGMIVRFLTGPAVMAATSIAVGLRGVNLHVSIVQAALPQGIVPFVFAKEYNVHPDVLSTAVIFGMLVAFPITMLYYVLLGI